MVTAFLGVLIRTGDTHPGPSAHQYAMVSDNVNLLNVVHVCCLGPSFKMAYEDERSLVHEPPDIHTLLLKDDSHLPNDFIDEKSSEFQDAPSRQQGDYLPWDRRWPRERGEDSGERSAASCDSASREMLLIPKKGNVIANVADEKKSPCTVTAILKVPNSESVKSDTTEEDELKSSKLSQKRSPVSVPTVVDEAITSWQTLPSSAVAGSHIFVETAEHSVEQDSQPKPAKNPLVSTEAPRRTELDTGEACDCLPRKGDVKVANGPTVPF